MKALKLHDVKTPLRKTSAGNKAVRILLVDDALTARSAGIALPALPASFKGLPGQRADIPSPKGRLVVIGCGMIAGADEGTLWETAGAAVIDSMRALKLDSAAMSGELIPAGIPAPAAAQRFAIGASLASYRCVAYRKAPPKDHFEIRELGIASADWNSSQRGRNLADSINWARALVDAPANLLHPQSFADEIRWLTTLDVEVQVLDLKALQRIGAGGLLAVGQSAEIPPCLVICRWQGRKGKDNDLGLVGKGLTFDGGGLNLKPYPMISKMKFDMAGAAAVVAAMRTLAQRKAPVNVVAALPLCENVIDGSSYRPGDVITWVSGLTIEVDNTDAEGRIVLADALSYLMREHQPRLLVDVATLTGSMMGFLHEEFAGFFTTDDELSRSLEDAARRSGEGLWRLPLSPSQDYLVDSEIADVRNMGAPGFMGNGSGSSISGAKFLQRFTGGARWAHIDIAGTSWATRPRPGIAKGPTGYGVRLLDALAEQLP